MDRPTTCRVCESACGLRATVEDGRVVALKPDPAHPISRGYACRKGTTFHARVQQHPDRLLRPRLRDGAGWRDVSWDEALARVGEGLRGLPRASVGLYSGNAAGHELGAVLGVAALQRGLGTDRHYSCLTLDNAPMFVVAERVFGHPLATFVADYAGADLVVLVGTDPLSSQASQAQAHPRATADLRARARAGQLVVVDPRRSDTAAAGLHLAPRVGTDLFWLAWLAAELCPELRAATAPFPLSRAARVTGLPEGALLALRDRLRAASRPLVWSGLGVLLGPHPTLGWWLTVAIQAALGGLDRPGGWVWQPGAVDLPRLASALGLGRYGEVRSPVDGRPSILGTLPSATLLDDDGLRALIVVGGDPASALPDAGRAAQRLASLDLLVAVDVFADSPTARLAHVLLPAATWLERVESGVHTGNQRPAPHVRVDAAVVPARGEAREALSILLGVCRAAGVAPFGSRLAGAALGALGIGGIHRLAARLPTPRTPAPRPRIVVPEWADALAAVADPLPGLRLLTSVRPIGAMNHWLRGERVVARVHPADADPGPAVLVGPAGELAVELVSDPSLARGTVVVPFGDRGCNANTLVDARALDPFTGQPASNGARVDVRGTGV